MVCITDDCENEVENPDTGLCSSCGHAMRKYERQQAKQNEKRAKAIKKSNEKKFEKKTYAITKISQKQAEYLARYSKEKDGWLNNKPCAVYPEERAEEIHHMWGRSINSFADGWARENDIPLLLDKRYWMAVCSRAHRKITDDSTWAVENGYSIPRNTPTLKA